MRSFILRTTLACLFLVVGTVAFGGEFNRTLSIGDTAPKWSALPGVDDQQYSLASFSKSKTLVVVFTCNSCPYAVDVQGRLIALRAKYSTDQVALVAINVNLIPEDLLPAMKSNAAENKFNYTYLFDESQQIAKDFGAKYTPECFVFDGDRKLIYQGSMDDSPDGKNVTKPYVLDAIEAALSDTELKVEESIPIGCRIRFKRERRSPKPLKTKE